MGALCLLCHPDQNAAIVPPASGAAAFVTGIACGCRQIVRNPATTCPLFAMSRTRRWKSLSESPAETAAIGEALAGCLRDGDVVLLHGDLGAGKTTLAKGIASALGDRGRRFEPVVLACQ